MRKRGRPGYTTEFKRRAVELSRHGNVKKVAEELGISRSALVRWRGEIGESEVRTTDGMSAREMKNLLAKQQREIERLQKEKKIAEMERDILKKATVFFAKENG